MQELQELLKRNDPYIRAQDQNKEGTQALQKTSQPSQITLQGPGTAGTHGMESLHDHSHEIQSFCPLSPFRITQNSMEGEVPFEFPASPNKHNIKLGSIALEDEVIENLPRQTSEATLHIGKGQATTTSNSFNKQG